MSRPTVSWARGSAVENPLANQETQVQFLGQEDPLEKEMATHSRVLAWEILWREETAVHRAAKSWPRLSD